MYISRILNSNIISDISYSDFIKSKINFDNSYSVVTDIVYSLSYETIIDNIDNICKSFYGFNKEIQDALDKRKIDIKINQNTNLKNINDVLNSKYKITIKELISNIDCNIVSIILNCYQSKYIIENYKKILIDLNSYNDDTISKNIRMEIDSLFRKRRIIFDYDKFKKDPVYNLYIKISCNL